VRRRQELVQVSQVILAKVTGGVAKRFQQLSDGRVFGLKAYR